MSIKDLETNLDTLKQYISFKLIASAVFAAMISGIIIGGLIVLKLDLPEISQLDQMRPPSITHIYSRNEILFDEWFIEKREQLSYTEIPQILIKAILTTEDRSFYTHNGVCVRGIIRAIFKDIIAGKYVEGASTITQQLAKTLFLSNKKKIARKIKEAILAFQLERRYTKNEILTRYLNQVYFGSGAYGIKSAAKIYFGKKIDELSIAECALIAGLPKAPSWYSPLINMKKATQRRNIVLKQMFDTGIISQTEFLIAHDSQISLKKKEQPRNKPIFFLDTVKTALEEQFGSEYIYQKGLNVQTTIDIALQDASEKAVERQLKTIENRNPNLTSEDLQAAVVVIQNKTGNILAMVGGRKQKENYYNRAIKARRQPGSAIKPLIYAYAIENDYTQASLILDAPVIYGGWRPENYSKTYSGDITLRKALALSLNIPCVRLLDQLGLQPVLEFCKKMGIDIRNQQDLTFALGSSEVTLLTLTAAYMVFPNQGIYVYPEVIRQVRNHRGRVLWVNLPKKRWVMSKAGAAVMCDMLKAVVSHGTAKSAHALGLPVAGKTGTSDNCKDAWFIGFSADVCIGVWVGTDNNKTIGQRETGGRAALPIWIDIMEAVCKKYGKKSFEVPENTMYVSVDVNTGKKSQGRNSTLMLKRVGPGVSNSWGNQ
jgi:penicillin-binding protein 1A